MNDFARLSEAPLTDEQLDLIKKYETGMSEYSRTMAETEMEMWNFHAAFEQYASYVEHYEAYYDDAPLTIKNYYQAMNEFDKLMAEYNQIQRGIDPNDPTADYSKMDEFDKRTADRFSYLERVLAA